MATQWTQRRLEKLCREWQENLRLVDWNIDVAFVRSYEDMEADAHATIEWSIERRTATIKVIHPDEYEDSMEPDYDVEQTVAHELMHLHFAPIEELGKHVPRMLVEQAIESITNAILILRHPRKRKKQ